MKRCAVLLLILMLAVPSAFAERLSDDELLSYYSGSVFFGDSIMQGFRRYRSAVRQSDPDYMEGVEVICTASITLYEASRRALQENRFRYRGLDMTMYQIAQKMQPRKIFILLGLNDPVGIKIDRAMDYIRDIMRGMGEFAPDSRICFFSHTPVTPAYCRNRNRPNYQEKVDEYNRCLQEVCEEVGAEYIDIAAAFKDEQGYLRDELSSDKICHLNDDGVAVWIRAMCDYAQSRYDAGLWVPGEEDTEDPTEPGPGEADPSASDESTPAPEATAAPESAEPASPPEETATPEPTDTTGLISFD